MNNWLYLLILICILPILLIIRYLVIGIITRSLGKNNEIYLSFRVNSWIWVLVIFFFIFSNFLEYLIPEYSTKFSLSSRLSKFSLSILIFSVFIFFSSIIIQSVKNRLSKTDLPLPDVEIFYNLIKALVILVGLITALWYLGVPMAPLLTTLGIGGFAISLALQPTLSNLFAGVNILFSKIFTKGDYLKIDNQYEGFVEDINWFSTILIMRNNNKVIVPNSKIINSVLISHKQEEIPMKVIISLSTEYGADLAKVEKVTLEVAKYIQKNIIGANPNFEPILRFSSFSDFSIKFNVILEVLDSNSQFLIVHEFLKELKKAYEKEKINIPFPTYVVHIRNE